MDLSITQAADKTGVPARTILWAINHDHLPARLLPIGARGIWLIDAHDLDAWFVERQRKSAG